MPNSVPRSERRVQFANSATLCGQPVACARPWMPMVTHIHSSTLAWWESTSHPSTTLHAAAMLMP